MNRRRLQREIWLVMSLLSIGIAVPMGALVIFASQYLEQELVHQNINDEMDFMMQEVQQHPDTLLPQTGTLKVWLNIDDQLHAPEPFHSLPVGEIHDVEYLNKRWHVLRKQTNLGLATAAIDISQIEYREMVLAYTVSAVVGIFLVLSLLLSAVFAKHLATPAANLANALSQLSPTDRKPLAADYKLEEMYQIALAADGLRNRQQQLLERERLFTAAASHELRTPLATIAASLELLQLKGIADDQQAAFMRAQRASNGLADLVDSLLFIARDNENRELPSVDVVATAKDCLDTHKEQSINAELHWQLSNRHPCNVAANPQHVRVVMTNLLRNAAQYTSSGVIELVVDHHGFEVCDSGEGLPDTPWQQLLEPYVSGSNQTRQQFGLGLYIVQRICSHYGWTLQAKPNQGGGTRMRVTFKTQHA